MDPFSGVRNVLSWISKRDSEWAGIPMPLHGERLIIEPSYPRGQALSEIGPTDEQNASRMGPHLHKFRNAFWSTHLRSTILVMEERGKITYGIEPGTHHFGFDMRTLGCSDAWGIEQESKALQTLGGLLGHHAFKQYLMTGMFIESSTRSKLKYVFRKLRPTVALGTKDDELRILCCLCLHPIGYYAGSWAGAMCPTDDVIAHLMLMRGDEAMFWKRANQICSRRPEAGL